MKRSTIAVFAAVAVALPSVAAAQFTTGQVAPWSDTDGYSNRGQCQSFLVKFGNNLRQNPELRDEGNRELNANEWNELFASQWECTRGEDGRWYVTWQL